MKLPPLNALRAFECAARTGSFSAAGAELGVSSAAVSMQVKNLEDWLALKLFVRRANQVRLTDAGRDYYQRAAVSLAEIASFTEAMTEGAKSRPLVISATPALAQLWLPERLKLFAQARPDVTVRLRIEDDRIDLEAEGIDARLAYGGEHPEHRTQALFKDRLVPVGADPQADVRSAPLVEVAWGETISSVPGWRQYFTQHVPLCGAVRGIPRRQGRGRKDNRARAYSGPRAAIRSGGGRDAGDAVAGLCAAEVL